MKKIVILIACIAMLVGCGTQDEIGEKPITTSEDESLENANLNASVVELTEEGFIAYPTIEKEVEDGSVSATKLDVDPNDVDNVSVIFLESTTFQIYEVDSDTLEGKLVDGSKEDIKKETHIYGFGTWNASTLQADKIIIWRMV